LGSLLAAGRRSPRVVRLLVAAAAVAIVAADASRMSKAEVERIWLPFVPWLLVSTACLPPRWQRPMLGVQVAVALLVQHLVRTNW
jgi:methylthioxylose transferase